MNQKEMYKKALELWGKEAQLNMVFEEMGELITELSREIRGRGKLVLLAEEIADVELMLEQLKFIYHLEGEVNDIKISKLVRLGNRIRASELKRGVKYESGIH